MQKRVVNTQDQSIERGEQVRTRCSFEKLKSTCEFRLTDHSSGYPAFGHSGRTAEKLSNRCDRLFWGAQVGAMTGRLHDHKFTVRYLTVHEFANAQRSDHIIRALQNKRSGLQLYQFFSVIRQERHPRKKLCNLRIRAAKAVFQFGRKFRPIGVSHDHWCHRGSPSQIVGVEHLSRPSMSCCSNPPSYEMSLMYRGDGP